MKPIYFLFSLLFSGLSWSTGFSLQLNDGILYGPGNLGVHKLQNGSIYNFIVTGPLEGKVEMVNNGGEPRNIIAEKLHTTEVDGALSDGTLINEDVDVGFVLSIIEPETREVVKLFVCSISGETVVPDDKGNITFKLTAGFDPGLPEYVVTMPVEFVTGVGTVPLSQKTLRGLSGGVDFADKYPAGYSIVGRLGDFDNDGMLDGIFVLGGHAPYDLIIAEGDPILVVRPFTSDIPVSPKDSSLYMLRGVIENFPEIIDKAYRNKNISSLQEYYSDIASRVEAVKHTAKKIRVGSRSISGGNVESVTRKQRFARKKRITTVLDEAVPVLELIQTQLSKNDHKKAKQLTDKLFGSFKKAIDELNAV